MWQPARKNVKLGPGESVETELSFSMHWNQERLYQFYTINLKFAGDHAFTQSQFKKNKKQKTVSGGWRYLEFPLLIKKRILFLM